MADSCYVNTPLLLFSSLHYLVNTWRSEKTIHLIEKLMRRLHVPQTKRQIIWEHAIYNCIL